MTTSDHSPDVFPSFSVVLPFLVSLPVIFLFTCTRGSVSFFRWLRESQRKLGVTIQSTCFTFKSSCRARYLESRSRNGVCVLRLLEIYNFPRKDCAMTASASSVLGIRSFKMKGVQKDSKVPTKWVLYRPWLFLSLVVNWESSARWRYGTPRLDSAHYRKSVTTWHHWIHVNLIVTIPSLAG